MAALDIPFAHNIASPMASRDDASIASSANNTHDPDSLISGPATYAAFSPVTLSANTPSRSAHRSTVLVHQKSPLLLATPPQITRALAYSHPFLLPLNTFVGLLTWSTGDPWQSFLLLCSFWLVILYGDTIILRAGPVAVGAGLIIGMYGRRYSPLSSSSWNGSAKNSKKKGNASQPPPVASSSSNASNTDSSLSDSKPGHKRNASEVTKTKHQKTLDEIVETLKEFTGRCNALMDPLLVMTDFLSTQTTATSATTKPALTAMFVRLIIVTPFWFALTFSPLQIITARRVVLVFGTIILTWHARVMRVTRTLLWRSSVIRRTASAVTGLRFDTPIKNHAALQMNGANLGKSGHKKSASRSAGVKFTFIIYENQRRWLGLGWTHSLFAYERAAWTDEHNNPVPPKDEFELPHVEDGSKMKWEWVESSRWRVDGVPDEQGAVDYDGDEARNGWIYYDNKWQYGRRGTDGWGRWTRRRKWYRDAELVEADEDTASIKSVPEAPLPKIVENGAPIGDDTASIRTLDDNASVHSTSTPSRFWPGLRRRTTNQSTVPSEKEKEREKRSSLNSSLGDDVSGLGIEVEMELQKQGKDGGQWGIGDEARMILE